MKELAQDHRVVKQRSQVSIEHLEDFHREQIGEVVSYSRWQQGIREGLIPHCKWYRRLTETKERGS